MNTYIGLKNGQIVASKAFLHGFGGGAALEQLPLRPAVDARGVEGLSKEQG